MMDGRIVKSGGPELAHELEEKGYEGVRKGSASGEPVAAGREAQRWRSRSSGARRMLDVERIRRPLPDPRADQPRQAPGLPGQREHESRSPQGDRHDHRVLRAAQRQPVPRRVRARGRGDGDVRGAEDHAVALHRRAGSLDGRVHPRHHRVDQPRRQCLGPEVPPRGRRDPVQRDGAPLEHRPVAARRRGDRRGHAARPDRGRLDARPRRRSRRSSPSERRSSPSPDSRTCSARCPPSTG